MPEMSGKPGRSEHSVHPENPGGRASARPDSTARENAVSTGDGHAVSTHARVHDAGASVSGEASPPYKAHGAHESQDVHGSHGSHDVPPAGFLRRVWHRLWATASGTLRIFLDADGIRAGAATAFYGAFSVAPLLVILTSAAAWIWGDRAAQAAILDTLRDLLGESEAQTLAGMLNRGLASITARKAISSTLFAVATTFVGASGMFVELRGALQAMAEQTPRRFSWSRFVRMRIVVIGVALGCAALVTAAMLLQTLTLGFVKWASLEWPALAGMVAGFELLWSWLVVVGLFYVVMHWLPDKRLPFRATLAGAALGAALFMAGRIAISAYIATTVTRSSLGAASSFAALLVWIYWSSLVFLLGAAFAGQLTKEAAARRQARSHGPR